MRARPGSFVFAFVLSVVSVPLRAADGGYDLVIRGGRVIDPESKLDAVRNIGIRAGRVEALTTEPLSGREVIEARGLIVAPGFIDLHQHGMNPEDLPAKAQDGVTMAAELEVGAADVNAWYAAREGKMPIHYAVSVGHIPCRLLVMGDRPDFLPPAKSNAATHPATSEQIEQLRALIERGLKQGAVAVGFGLQYTPAATQWEAIEIFRTAARYHASCHLHMRAKGELSAVNVFTAIEELIAATAVTGAPAHVCHVQSTANELTPRVLELVEAARRRGLDVTAECYPYTAGMTDLKSAIFDPGWQRNGRYDFKDLLWPPTGERLTAETFAKYREMGGRVIFFSNREEDIEQAVAHPLTMIASDGFPNHPRHAGTSARILGHYVRERKLLTLTQAIEKLSLMPARRLEARVPAMMNKGRVRLGADADLVVFDPDQVIDRATYEHPELTSTGIPFVVVDGKVVVREGKFQAEAKAGRAVRAPIAP